MLGAIYRRDYGRFSIPCIRSGMFSKENRRFTILALSLVAIVIGTLSGVTKAVISDHASNAYVIGGVSAMVILQLLMMMKQEQAGKAMSGVADKVDELKKETNGNLTKAIAQVAEEVKTAKDEPAPGQEQMPRTPQELQSLIKLFVREMTDEVLERAVHTATTAATRMATKDAVLETIKELKIAGYINDNGESK